MADDSDDDDEEDEDEADDDEVKRGLINVLLEWLELDEDTPARLIVAPREGGGTGRAATVELRPRGASGLRSAAADDARRRAAAAPDAPYWSALLVARLSDGSLAPLLAASGLAQSLGYDSADAMLVGMRVAPVAVLQPPSAPAAPSAGSAGTSTGAIAGGAIGGIACVLLVLSQAARRHASTKGGGAIAQVLSLRDVDIYAGGFAGAAAPSTTAGFSPRQTSHVRSRSRSPQAFAVRPSPAATPMRAAARSPSARTHGRSPAASAATAPLRSPAAAQRGSPRLATRRVALAVVVRELPQRAFFMCVGERRLRPRRWHFSLSPLGRSNPSSLISRRLRSKGALSAAGELLATVPLTTREAATVGSSALLGRLMDAGVVSELVLE